MDKDQPRHIQRILTRDPSVPKGQVVKTRYSRKVTAAAVILGATAALSGCGLSGEYEDSGGDDELVIGLAVANQQADFFNMVRIAAEERAEEAGVDLVINDAMGDANTQVSQIQNFITQDVDAIIYIPAGSAAASVPVRDAREADIPVVTVDRNPETEPGDTFIASDSVAAAEELGEWVGEQTGGTGQIAAIQGQVGTTPEIDRDTGFTQAMENYPDMEEVARQSSDQWSQSEGFDIATDMLQRHPDLDVFFGRADALALGAASAARNAGRADDMLIVGFDGDVAGLEGVRDGVLDATVTQQTYKMGGLAIDSALALANGEDVPEVQLQDAILTTQENAEEFIEDHP